MAIRAKRYPLRPLAAAIGMPLGDTGTLPALGEALGVTDRTIARWLTEGVPEDRTDAYACHVANMHPMSIWPDWSWLDAEVAALNEADALEAGGSCHGVAA